MLLLLFLQTLMLILFSLLINSSLLCMLTSLKQWSLLHCLMWMFCLYNNISHWIRWELISHHTSTSFWFRVKVCWFLTVVSAVKNMIWHFFQNVIVPQNISVSVAATASDVIMLLTVLYTTMMFSLSSWTMRMTMMSMRMSMLLSQDESCQCCWQEQLLSILTLKYVQLFFLLLRCL